MDQVLEGKTTNLRYIHDHTNDNIRGQLVSIDTKGDRTLFFDFLSLDLGKIRDYKIRVQLYTVPGQVHYDATRKLVLRGADGIVFVADSMRVQREKNVESLENMAVNLKEKSIDMTKMPLVMQYNKRDLEGSNIPVLSIDELERDLNAHLKAPFFTASALKGDGVYETLREISKLAVRDVSRKVLAKGTTLMSDKDSGLDLSDLEKEIDSAVDNLLIAKEEQVGPANRMSNQSTKTSASIQGVDNSENRLSDPFMQPQAQSPKSFTNYCNVSKQNREASTISFHAAASTISKSAIYFSRNR